MAAHKELFRNHWKGILPHFGLSLKMLKGKHGPCPFCGGKDRFRFSDYRGLGDWICNQCGAGDGIEFVKRAMQVDFREAVRLIEPIAAKVKLVRPMFKPGKEYKHMLNSIWKAAEVPTRGCPVSLYLENRVGRLRAIPPYLKYHPKLAYTHENGTRSFHPAMLALVTDAEGKACNIHRTYLTHDGYKADVPQPKKTCVGSLPKGYAIRLTPISERLGIAEGIETALAVSKLAFTPCWAAVNSHGLSTWEPPDGVREIIVFGDHDVKYGGQVAAYSLAHRLACNDRYQIAVVWPPAPAGQDWADVLGERIAKNAA